MKSLLTEEVEKITDAWETTPNVCVRVGEWIRGQLLPPVECNSVNIIPFNREWAKLCGTGTALHFTPGLLL